jgi:hypothetical protein
VEDLRCQRLVALAPQSDGDSSRAYYVTTSLQLVVEFGGCESTRFDSVCVHCHTDGEARGHSGCSLGWRGALRRRGMCSEQAQTRIGKRPHGHPGGIFDSVSKLSKLRSAVRIGADNRLVAGW